MKYNLKKISIIGGAGTGKTTLAKNLAKVLKLPLYHLYVINYNKNFQQRDKKRRDKDIIDIINKDKWITDGTYTSTLEQRLEKSDLIIYLDYSSFSQIKGVIKRYIKDHGNEKEEIPGCKERLDIKFIVWVLKWRKNKRKKVLKILEKIDKEKVLIFKNKRELNKWFEKQFDFEIKNK